MWDRRLDFIYCFQNKGSHCSPWDKVEGDAPLLGDFRVIVCPTPSQMNDFCDLLGTPDAPVSKIASVKYTMKYLCSLFFIGENSMQKLYHSTHSIFFIFLIR